MPLYEYACPDCGVRSERLKKQDERDEPVPCPGCGAESRAVFSAAAVHASAGAPSPAPHRHAGPGCCGGGACGMS